MNELKKKKQPWPTKKAMEQVYAMHLWGGKDSAFYSGSGSHDLEVIEPYLAAVQLFLKSFEPSLTVCDLGCGDFNVGKQLLPYASQYYGVDIVQDLITYNKRNFINQNLDFYCLDIAKDDWPSADCLILRQVLQHLSNAEIQNVVSKLTNYKYLILTEHVPEEDFIPNKDIISGQGIRLKHNSGVDLLKAPFNLVVKSEKQLVKTELQSGKGVIITTLYTII
ncbi:class I SAM-dependent methyltransferase [Bizionia sp. KMM 8389]